MKIELVSYTCANCANSFDAPALGESAYGEFLLWSKNGRAAYLNAFEDMTYKAVSNFLVKSPKIYGLQPLERTKILQKIYGSLVCDPDDKGSPFEMNVFPPCPKCGSQLMSSWMFKNPPEIVEIFIPPVTHIRWNALTDSEMQNHVDSRL